MAVEQALGLPEVVAPRMAPAPLALRRCLLLAVLLLLIMPFAAQAAPVNWQPVPATREGEQWWDTGSLRPTASGTLTVLSRYRSAEVEGRQATAHLVVMEINCDSGRFRDTWVDGLPQWGADWQRAAGEDLTQSVVEAACAAMARS